MFYSKSSDFFVYAIKNTPGCNTIIDDIFAGLLFYVPIQWSLYDVNNLANYHIITIKFPYDVLGKYIKITSKKKMLNFYVKCHNIVSGINENYQLR